MDDSLQMVRAGTLIGVANMLNRTLSAAPLAAIVDEVTMRRAKAAIAACVLPGRRVPQAG